MDVKKEIIDIINKIENQELLRLLLDIVKTACNQLIEGKWGT